MRNLGQAKAQVLQTSDKLVSFFVVSSRRISMSVHYHRSVKHKTWILNNKTPPKNPNCCHCSLSTMFCFPCNLYIDSSMNNLRSHIEWLFTHKACWHKDIFWQFFESKYITFASEIEVDLTNRMEVLVSSQPRKYLPYSTATATTPTIAHHQSTETWLRTTCSCQSVLLFVQNH